MPSVIGLLEERERDASRRVETPREAADRILTELRDAERSWERFVTAREAVAEVLAGTGGDGARRGRRPGDWGYCADADADADFERWGGAGVAGAYLE